jgi:hypothetical protein
MRKYRGDSESDIDNMSDSDEDSSESDEDNSESGEDNSKSDEDNSDSNSDGEYIGKKIFIFNYISS